MAGRMRRSRPESDERPPAAHPTLRSGRGEGIRRDHPPARRQDSRAHADDPQVRPGRVDDRSTVRDAQGRDGPAARQVTPQPRRSRRSARQHLGGGAGRRTGARRPGALLRQNERLGFTIPYVHEGRTHEYVPDFLVRLVPRADGVMRTLIVEVSGGRKSPGPAAAKADTARSQWCAAVNNWGELGRWGYVEIRDRDRFRSLLDGAIESLYADQAITGLLD